MTRLQALEALHEKVETEAGSDRTMDAEIDAVLRIGTPRLKRDCPWAYNNFPTWRAMAPGRCEVVHTDGRGGAHWKSQRFTSSLDAAKALHDALLPGWVVNNATWWPTADPAARIMLVGTHPERDGTLWHSARDGKVEASASDPARAWLLAILDALITQEERP